MVETTLDSLERGLAAAEYVLMRGHVSLAEVMEHLDVSKSTAYRALVTLERRGWVRHDTVRGGYRPGPILRQFADATPNERLREIADEPLQHLAAEVGETVNLAVPVGSVLIYDHVIESSHDLRMYVAPGTAATFHATALGRAYLSALPAADAAALLGEGPFRSFTARTQVDRERVLQEIDDARGRGYAVDDEEHEDGARCVAVAVLDEKDRPIGAVSVSGPVGRMSDARIRDIAHTLHRVTQEISALRHPTPDV